MPGRPFTSATATAASAVGVAVRKAKRAKRKIDNLTPESIVTMTLSFLVDGMLSPDSPPYVKMGSARTLLTTLYGAGVKPSQRDLAVIFRKLHTSPEDNHTRTDSANDSDVNATPPASEEKSK